MKQMYQIIVIAVVVFFLNTLYVVAMGGCGNATTKGSSEYDPLDVLIIGAGWAGLAAAEKLFRDIELSPKNHFCVLEGRDAIGGRSRTMLGLLVPGLPTELGSAWIWRGTSIEDIFRDAGLVTDDAPSHFGRDGEYGLYNERMGGLIKEDTWEAEELRAEYDAFVDYAKEWATHETTLKNLIDNYFEKNPHLDNFSKQAIRASLCGTIHSEFGSYFGDADSEFLNGHLTPSYTIKFVGVPNGGFQRALDYFSAPFIDHVQLNTQVLEVNYEDTNFNDVVKVTSLDRTTNNTVVHYARTVICTVSLGVLQYGDLKFVPPLPYEKRQAIEDMGMGNTIKCILYWDKTTKNVAWWPKNYLDLQLITEEVEDSMDWTYFINDQHHTGNEDNYIMTAWIGGIAADKWENRTDEETIFHVLGNLRRMFPSPNLIPEPTNYIVTRWKSDPFTRGTYHYHRAGIDTYANQDIMARSIAKRLFFAGEATTTGMSAPNAFWSGERAVDEIERTGVLDNVFSIFSHRFSSCGRIGRTCASESDCCRGLICDQRSTLNSVKHCTRPPGVWSIEETLEVGSGQVDKRNSPFRRKHKSP